MASFLVQMATEQEPRVHDNGTQSKESILKVLVTDWNAYALFTCAVKHLCSNYTQQKSISKYRGEHSQFSTLPLQGIFCDY